MMFSEPVSMIAKSICSLNEIHGFMDGMSRCSTSNDGTLVKDRER